MNRFDYVRASTLNEAMAALRDDPEAKIIAGGTNLVDLMKYEVTRPSRVIDITRLPFDAIETRPDGGLRIGALVSNAAAAYHPEVQARYPLLASAILAGASGQLRNAATTGGNLLQRTRCYYFYDVATPCNKRAPGSGCPAIGGVNRIHAIQGASDSCIATHPSDMCVAMAALEATVNVAGPDGERAIAFADFHRLPGDRPDLDNTLAADEIVTSVDLPPTTYDAHHSYLKLRDRLSYAFALVSVAAALRLDGGVVSQARIALGGVAHKPWRSTDAEAVLVGQTPTAEGFVRAAGLLLDGAVGQGQNDFKIGLARDAIVRALEQAAAGTPQSQTDKRVR
ncbi:xanthine dehydrogenase family protein subunit M [Brevundimonas sp. BT-123]|uniref:FAD binding domain-containing protein n=1 Tax=Brevundimonas sp. BT-123 TaxID=2986928 RepID=UPI002235A03A|nr:xanthine dehydrogenase family protein subunit M [Brevundimonas sp. BT-123]MCW0047493.1 xanthine dehydrogenase family protein subunit M [Brevundimonas sp. BT-123]